MRRLKFSAVLLASAFAFPAYGAEPATPVAAIQAKPTKEAAANAASTKEAATKAAPTKEVLKLDAEVVALLRRTALALENRSIEPEEQAGFRALITAGDLLREDKTLAPSERERLRALCRARLGQAQEVLKRQTAKEAAAKETAAKQAPDKRKIAATNAVISKPATVDAPANQFLAQQQPGGLGFGGAGNNAAATGPNSTKASAEELMEIITSSIKPESWEENGGTTGVIRYFSIGHALVIRNTADVHGNLGGLIGQLRN